MHELLTGIDAQGHVLVSRVFDGSVPLWVGWAADCVAYTIVLLICVTSLVLLRLGLGLTDPYHKPSLGLADPYPLARAEPEPDP